MAEIEQRVPECQSYLPGHTVHYIQVREAWRHPEHRRGGTVRSIAGRVVEFVSDDGEMFDLVTHDPDHVGRLVAELAVGPPTTLAGAHSDSRNPRAPG
jgi:hypothetical protein